MRQRQVKWLFSIACLAFITFCFSVENAHADPSLTYFRQYPQKHLPQITLSPPDGPQDEAVTNLYVWRHGESTSNVTKILSGGEDTGALLTEKGQQQAMDLAKKILGLELPLQAIYSSDLPRAVSTAQPVLAAFSGMIQGITPSPQLREILHGKYGRTSGSERNKQAELMFREELDKMEKSTESIRERIGEGILDRSLFCRTHPISGRVAQKEGSIIDVAAFLQYNVQEPETPYELYYRIHAEFIRIAEEMHNLGLSEVGISTHGAVMATLANVAQYGQEHCFIPVYYQSKPLQSRGELVVPASVKMENCALAHFRYWHKSKQLQFCGMLN
jgi:broad specificity phosphatase PhoE